MRASTLLLVGAPRPTDPDTTMGYPAALLAMSSGRLFPNFRRRRQSLFHRLVRVPVREGATRLAARDGAELTLIGFGVTLSTLILTLWLLPV
jgi:hypothetical protein